MKSKILPALFLLLLSMNSKAQESFEYDLQLIPVSIPGFPGLHSYAFGQYNGKWVFIGGRRDGLHARQPFNAFPAAQNNTDIFVADVQTQQYWSAPLSSLSAGLREQLQSTNMNFFQDGNTLYILGGYAYSATAADHITFPNLTSVDVPGLIQAVVAGTSITSYFKQISDGNFAVTGGHLGKIGNTFYLVGGHRFDGRYNPMGNPTYTQTYTNQIRKFTIDNSGSLLSIANYTEITDPVHLHRRDYNLLPQIFPDGTPGYMISSGVFQINDDLPFLYPVDITETGITPQTGFNQYLSNYHSAVAALYDSAENRMHNLFFGGMSRYYYQNETLIEDNQVPFIKTISRVTRFADGTLQEFKLPLEMPSLKGASAEFIPNEQLPVAFSDIVKLNAITADTFIIGHIVGGIQSTTLNPFGANQTANTSADNTIYAVRLINTSVDHTALPVNTNPFDFTINPNPAQQDIRIQYHLKDPAEVHYFITTADGRIVSNGTLGKQSAGNHTQVFSLQEAENGQVLFVSLVFNNLYYVTRKAVLQR